MIFHYIYIIEYLFFSINFIFLSHFLLSMATQLGYSDFSNDQNLSNDNENNYNRNSRESFINRKRRTIKRREGFNNENKKESPSRVNKIKAMMSEDDDEEEDNLANFTSEFNPPPVAESAGGERIDSRDIEQQSSDNIAKQNMSSSITNDNDVSPEGYNNLSGGYTENYVNQFVPYYQNAANVATGNNNNTEITEKLNYLINLIEEQKDEKVGHVAEELILYSFLGVFVIYIVDSFARVGKYVR